MTDTTSVASTEVQSTVPAAAARQWTDPMNPGTVITKEQLLSEAYTVSKKLTVSAVELEVKAMSTKAQANWTIASKFGSVQDRDVYDKAIEGWEDAYIGDVITAIASENPTMKNADVRKAAQKTVSSFAQRKSQFTTQLDACFNGGDGAVFFLQNMTKHIMLGSEDFMGFCRAVRDASVKGKFDYSKYMNDDGSLKTENGKLTYGKEGKVFFLQYEQPKQISAPAEGGEGEPESTGNARTPEGEAPKAQLGKVQAWNDARMGDIERQLQGQSQTVQLKFLQKMCDVIISDFPTANIDFEIDGRKMSMQARTVAHAMRKALQAQEAIVAPKAQTKTERQQAVQQAVSPMIQDSIEADKQPEPEISDTVEA